MTALIAKDGVDIGIVVRDIDAALSFYRDLLGFELVGQVKLQRGPHLATDIEMWRLQCGASVIKLVRPCDEPTGKNARGGVDAAYGYRYWTIAVTNLDEVVAACDAAGYRVVIPPSELRPGARIAMVEDAEHNWVEFLAG